MSQSWCPDNYQRHAAFVPALGATLVDLLAPRAGERILDLGCGDGTLTGRITAAGATIVGVDKSPEMVAAAQARGIDARVMDVEALTFDHEFDAAFSNAVLHWVRDHDAMLASVWRALKPGGRFIAEFGGHGNIAAIAVAISAVLAHRGVAPQSPWYYPTAEEYAERLQSHGFFVETAKLFPRPTPLPTGIRGWLDTFAQPMLGALPQPRRADAEKEIETLLRPVLCDRTGRWTADYVRLRIVATAAPTP